jgi:molybdopterin converting factor small subunit
MEVKVEYNVFQLRQITGVQNETAQLAEGSTVRQMIEELGVKHGERFRSFVLPAGSSRPKTMLIVDGRSVIDLEQELKAGSRIHFIQLASSG